MKNLAKKQFAHFARRPFFIIAGIALFFGALFIYSGTTKIKEIVDEPTDIVSAEDFLAAEKGDYLTLVDKDFWLTDYYLKTTTYSGNDALYSGIRDYYYVYIDDSHLGIALIFSSRFADSSNPDSEFQDSVFVKAVATSGEDREVANNLRQELADAMGGTVAEVDDFLRTDVIFYEKDPSTIGDNPALIYFIIGGIAAAVFVLMTIIMINTKLTFSYLKLKKLGDPEAIFEELSNAVEMGTELVYEDGLIANSRYMLFGKVLVHTSDVMWVYKLISNGTSFLHIYLADGKKKYESFASSSCDEIIDSLSEKLPTVMLGYDNKLRKMNHATRKAEWERHKANVEQQAE